MRDETKFNLKLLLGYFICGSYAFYNHICTVNVSMYFMGGGWSLKQTGGQFVLSPIIDYPLHDDTNHDDSVLWNCQFSIHDFPRELPIANVNSSSHKYVIQPKKSQYDSALSSINYSLSMDRNILLYGFIAVLFSAMLNFNSKLLPEAKAKVIAFFWFYGLFTLSLSGMFNSLARHAIGSDLCLMLQSANISAENLYVGYDPLAGVLANITTTGEGLMYYLPYMNENLSPINSFCDPMSDILFMIGGGGLLLRCLYREGFDSGVCMPIDYLRYSTPYVLFVSILNLYHGLIENMTNLCNTLSQQATYIGVELYTGVNFVYGKCCYRNSSLFADERVNFYGAIDGSNHDEVENRLFSHK